tara:strand:- start:1 stop:801 length:801 start_codon:yes stop_codon:yes gene_type:complete
MLDNKDIKFFQENGYLIKKSEKIQNIKYFENIIKHEIFKIKKIDKKKFQLDKLHKFINLKELNNIRLELIKRFNLNRNNVKIFYESAKNILDELVGNELMAQKNINISLQLPKDKNSQLPMHSDVFGDESPFEVVVWIPMVDVNANSSSMFITKPSYNKLLVEKIINYKNKSISEIYQKNKKKFSFLSLKFGEILVFSPILLHGNIINKTNLSRISLNCRFKSLLSPTDVLEKSTKNIPNFFTPLNVKPLTKIGFNFISKITKKIK